MPEYTVILRELGAEKFAEVLSSSARKSRETYFHRHNIKTKKSGKMPKPGAKNEARTAALYDLLQTKEDEEMAEEILRSWLLNKREILSAALDHLKIPHENGLTDSEELDKFEKITAKDIKAIVKAVGDAAEAEDVAAYLKFMGAKNVDKALG